MVMEFTLAIVSGFKHEIERKLTGFDAEVTVLPAFFPGEEEQRQHLRGDATLRSIVQASVPDDADVALSFRQPGILKTDTDFEGVMFESREPRSDFSFERGNIVAGAWPSYEADSAANDIVISTVLADRLGLDVGSRLYTTFIIDGAVKLRRNTVAALYKSDFGEYDRRVVYCSLPLLQSVAGVDSLSGNRIDIRGIDIDLIDRTGDELQNALYLAAASGALEGYNTVTTVKQTGAMYFNWLALLDTNVVVIFILMLCVASLTMISSLFILILERVRTIGVLRALGATRSGVRDVFVFMALRVVGIGMLAGNILGLGLLILQSHYHFIPLNPDMYYLNTVPVLINPAAFVALNIGVAVAAWLILVLPATLASKVSPAEAANFD